MMVRVPKNGAGHPDADIGAGVPVGQGDYSIQQGESVLSIASRRRHLPGAIWSDLANSELMRVRRDPRVLLPGDRLTIPPLGQKAVTLQTGKRH